MAAGPKGGEKGVEIEVERAKAERTAADAQGWVLSLWKGRPVESAIGAADAAASWGLKRQAAVPRLAKLVSRGWLAETKHGRGKASEWTLAPEGLAVVKSGRETV